MHNKNFSIKDFKSLKVWQKSGQLSKDIYTITKKFPSLENYIITSQILRSTNSIGANIAEGNAMIYVKKELSFYNNSIGSASETRHWLALAYQNNYISKQEYDLLDAKTLEIIKMLYGVIRKLNNSLETPVC